MKHDSRLRSARFLLAAALFLPGASRAQQPQYNISTVAGNGTDGYSGDNAAANQAEQSDPCGIAVDGAGNIYIADQNNNRIRKAAPGGNITTVIGNGTAGFTGDGGAPTQGGIMAPCGVAVDAAGDTYFSQTDSGGSMDSAIRELADQPEYRRRRERDNAVGARVYRGRRAGRQRAVEQPFRHSPRQLGQSVHCGHVEQQSSA